MKTFGPDVHSPDVILVRNGKQVKSPDAPVELSRCIVKPDVWVVRPEQRISKVLHSCHHVHSIDCHELST